MLSTDYTNYAVEYRCEDRGLFQRRGKTKHDTKTIRLYGQRALVIVFPLLVTYWRVVVVTLQISISEIMGHEGSEECRCQSWSQNVQPSTSNARLLSSSSRVTSFSAPPTADDQEKQFHADVFSNASRSATTVSQIYWTSETASFCFDSCQCTGTFFTILWQHIRPTGLDYRGTQQSTIFRPFSPHLF